MRNGKSLSRPDRMLRIWPRSGREIFRLFADCCLRNVLVVCREAAEICYLVSNNRDFEPALQTIRVRNFHLLASIRDDSRPRYIFTGIFHVPIFYLLAVAIRVPILFTGWCKFLFSGWWFAIYWLVVRVPIFLFTG